MCTEPLYAIRLKTEFDEKFIRFGKHTPIKVLCSVKSIGKDTSKLDYDPDVYDLLMISCGHCLQCRMNKVKQRAVMCICESLEHEQNSFVTLTFGYPQLYCYYRHYKKLSHYLAAKKAHFHEWSLETELFRNFMKRLRQWYYNYQLSEYLIKSGRDDLVYKKYVKGDIEYFKVKSHIRIPKCEKDVILKDFKPKKIRFMHCGEYGSKRQRSHHHVILHGFQFPDIEPIYENNQKYYISDILSKLWPFGIHRIGDCSYNSCAYVARYVTKKMNGSNSDEYYNGRKPEYATYSTKPVLGASYFIKNCKEFVNTQLISVVADKKYECSIPKSYDNILKKLDIDLFNDMKEKRVKDSLKNLDKVLSQNRSIYSKLDSNEKNVLCTLKKLVRGYEEGAEIIFDDYLLKAKAFGVNTKFFCSEFSSAAKKLLDTKTFKDHKPHQTYEKRHTDYYKFELARKRHINNCYQLHYSDDQVDYWKHFYENLPNPFKMYKCYKRGRSLPDDECLNENSYIDEKGKELIYAKA